MFESFSVYYSTVKYCYRTETSLEIKHDRFCLTVLRGKILITNHEHMAEETRSYNLANAAGFQLTGFNIYLECLYLFPTWLHLLVYNFPTRSLLL